MSELHSLYECRVCMKHAYEHGQKQDKMDGKLYIELFFWQNL